MKHLLRRSLAMLMVCICCAGAFAEEAVPPETQPEEANLDVGPGSYNPEIPMHLTVGNSTKVSGSFFSRQFGNNTSDIDVRAMLHGYNPIVWDTQLTFVTDPMVVKGMTVSADREGNSVYTFDLYDDLYWNDGSQITARDYAFAYAMQASPEFEAISGDTDVWKHLVGYEEYASGDAQTLRGVRLLGDYRFSVAVKAEYLPYFYEYSYLYIMPSPISVLAPGCEVADEGSGVFIRNEDPAVLERLYTSELLTDTILDPETGYLSHPMLTCGPYSLVSYDREAGKVDFTINPYYKGDYEGARPLINDITLVPVLPQEMVQKLQDGEIDVINKVVDGDVITELFGLSSTGAFAVKNYPRLGYGFLGLTCEQGPQQFQKVRQALAYAFDGQDYVMSFLKGFGLQVFGFYGIGQWMTQVCMSTVRPEIMTDAEEEMWNSLTLDELNRYDYDPEKALQLLIEDGWVLNEEGKPFRPDEDTLRYKELENGELMPLSFKFGLIQDNLTAQDVLSRMKKVLEPMGVEIVETEDSFYNILSDYLREEGTRVYDISFLAYNFVSIFDPLVEFAHAGEYPGSQNATAIYDDELIADCWTLHHTEPGDYLGFVQNWLVFQKRFNELLPTVPLYSDVYFDFHISNLVNYDPEAEANWPRAILNAYITAELPEEEGGEEAPAEGAAGEETFEGDTFGEGDTFDDDELEFED